MMMMMMMMMIIMNLIITLIIIGLIGQEKTYTVALKFHSLI